MYTDSAFNGMEVFGVIFVSRIFLAFNRWSFAIPFSPTSISEKSGQKFLESTWINAVSWKIETMNS